jgi:hypothetical protein
MYRKELLDQDGVTAVLDRSSEFVIITEGSSMPEEKQNTVAITVDTVYEIVRQLGKELRYRKNRVIY